MTSPQPPNLLMVFLFAGLPRNRILLGVPFRSLFQPWLGFFKPDLTDNSF